MKCPELENLQRQQEDPWLPRAEEKGDWGGS